MDKSSKIGNFQVSIFLGVEKVETTKSSHYRITEANMRSHKSLVANQSWVQPKIQETTHVHVKMTQNLEKSKFGEFLYYTTWTRPQHQPKRMTSFQGPRVPNPSVHRCPRAGYSHPGSSKVANVGTICPILGPA